MSDQSDNPTNAPGDEAGTPQDAATGSPPAGTAEEQLAALRAERDRFKDNLRRAMADQDNFRKRARRDADEAMRKAREDVLRELLPVFDNLERALQYVDTGADAKAIGKGVEMVLRLFED